MAAGRNNDWKREEHILAFNLYCKIPFGTIHIRNPRIIELAKILGRNVGAVSYKLANFARLDSDLQARGIKGLSHGAKGEAEIWREFDDNPEMLAFESERLLARFTGRKLEQIAEIDERELPKEGLEAIAITAREVFVVSRRKKNGFYGFPNNFIEKELDVSATTRNWSTVTKIVYQLRKSAINNRQSTIT